MFSPTTKKTITGIVRTDPHATDKEKAKVLKFLESSIKCNDSQDNLDCFIDTLIHADAGTTKVLDGEATGLA